MNCLKKIFLIFSGIFFLINGNGQTSDLDNSYYFTGKLHPYIDSYNADRASLYRFYTIEGSPERRERLKVFNLNYLKQLQQINFNKLEVSDKTDYLLLKRNVDNEIRLLNIEEKEYNEIRFLIPFADSIYQLEKLRRRGAYLNSKQISGMLHSADNQIKELTLSINQGKEIDKLLVLRATEAIRGLQSALKSVYDFYNTYDPDFTWWVEQPYKKIITSLENYSKLIQNKAAKETIVKDDGSGIIGSPIGREELIRQLEFEMIPYTPEELIEIANKEFAWCDAEMLKVSKEMGFGNDWHKALEKVKNTYLPAGRQPEMMMQLYTEAVDFLKQNDLISIPPLAEETWRMMMLSPERQLQAPFFLGGETLWIAYPSNSMDHDAKMMSLRGNNPHFARAVLHHELIAGHRLQQFMTDRYKAYRRFNTPFWTEGWALYWEMLLWENGFPQSPEDKVGMLFWRMHRCARIIFSLNYHLGKWTPQQCIDFLVNRVGHEKANAEGEVRRSFTGRYGPLYQLAYMIGALQFSSLKKEVVDTKKLMSLKEFNDRVMKENNIPVEMLRAILINQPLNKNHKTSWKFYE